MLEKPGGTGDPPMVVYRVVDAVELARLETHGDYGSNPSRFGKCFALTSDGATAFADAALNAGTTITRTTLPASIVSNGTRFNDPGPNGAGASIFFAEAQLAEVYGTRSPPVVWHGARG